MGWYAHVTRLTVLHMLSLSQNGCDTWGGTAGDTYSRTVVHIEEPPLLIRGERRLLCAFIFHHDGHVSTAM